MTFLKLCFIKYWFLFSPFSHLLLIQTRSIHSEIKHIILGDTKLVKSDSAIRHCAHPNILHARFWSLLNNFPLHIWESWLSCLAEIHNGCHLEWGEHCWGEEFANCDTIWEQAELQYVTKVDNSWNIPKNDPIKDI